MVSGFDWFGMRRPRASEQTGQTLFLVGADVAVPDALEQALEQRFGRVLRLVVGRDIPLEPAAARARLRRLKPDRLIVAGAPGLPPALWMEVGVPWFWLNAQGPVASQATRCCLRSAQDAHWAPEAPVTGDPFLALDAMPQAPETGDFCDRFQEMHERGRWILYVPESADPEEDLAYQTFLRLSRRGVGLLVLAPADPARHETVYRDAMRFHLLTHRHRRLMTSYVPHKTRVYYIEDAPALAQMYPCADVVVAGGTFAAASTRPPELLRPLCLGKAVVVGPRGTSALQQAAIQDGAILQAVSAEALESCLGPLLLDSGLRATQGAQGRAWLAQQCGALARVIGCVAQW